MCNKAAKTLPDSFLFENLHNFEMIFTVNADYITYTYMV